MSIFAKKSDIKPPEPKQEQPIDLDVDEAPAGTGIAGAYCTKLLADGLSPQALAVGEDGGQFGAVGEQHAAVNVRAVGQADEGGKFAPRQRRASGAELDLIGVELAEQGLQHAIHALVLLREAEIIEDVERDRTVRPDLRGVVFPLRGEIGFGENFKRGTTRLFVGQRGDF